MHKQFADFDSSPKLRMKTYREIVEGKGFSLHFSSNIEIHAGYICALVLEAPNNHFYVESIDESGGTLISKFPFPLSFFENVLELDDISISDEENQKALNVFLKLALT